MNLADVMDDLATAVSFVEGLRVVPMGSPINPPGAWVEWPEQLDFDIAMGRGGDRITIPLRVVVGQLEARASTVALAGYVAGSGPSSIKAAVEAFDSTAYSSARVTSAEFGVITIASVEYLAATFSIDVIGQGA